MSLAAPGYVWKTSKNRGTFVWNPTTYFLPQNNKVFWQSFCEIRSEYGMSYLVQLAIKFPIDWNLKLETLIFDQFSQKSRLIEIAKFRQKIYFSKSDRDR